MKISGSLKKWLFLVSTFLSLSNWSALPLAAAETASESRAASQALPAIQFQGKPFFPIGVFDLARSGAPRARRLFEIDSMLYECGVNSAFFGTLGMPDDPTYPGYELMAKALNENQKDPRFAKLALIVQLGGSVYCESDAEQVAGKSKRRYRPLNPAELAARTAFLTEAFQTFARYPNIIGYSYDEPENTFNNFYQRTRSAGDLDRGIAGALLEYLGWIRPLVHKNHPGALLMPIIAWWGTYQYVDPLYDVLIADQYPRSKDKNEFAAPLYEVSYDAGRAVAAARAHRKTVVYMPPNFDRLPGDWAIMTRAELRYVYFAPIVRGAMGLMGWRLNRCSQTYRENIVYPTLKEVARFQEFYLGEWHDRLISSDHDTATASYLKQFSVRSKLLNDEADGEVKKVTDAVPDVSHCLRRHPDGRWLLLAVNNRREPLTVRFKVHIPDRPETLQEALSDRTIKLEQDGTLSDHFAPFGVHAYIIHGTLL